MTTNSEVTDYRTEFTEECSLRNRMVFKNNFGWSISREALFDSCRRAYYFHYYLSWGGWNADAPVISRKAYKLKRLVSLPLWRGQLIHYIASKILQSTRVKKRIPAEDDVINYTVESFEKQFRFSKDKKYLREPKKKRGKLNTNWLALRDHEYGIDIPAGELKKTHDECVEAVRALLSSSILEMISKTDPSEWVIEDIDFSEFAQSFQFEKATVFLKTDFIFRGCDNRFNIVDWKTYSGRSSSVKTKTGKALDQLNIYGYYAAAILGEPAENISLREVNLLDEATEQTYTTSEESIAAARVRLTKGIRKLSSVLKDNDIKKNIPLEYRYFPPNRTSKCARCNFLRICDK
ncbi:MAG TPA: PD-(D/E)XK nuclease family protein [Candidatus Krumholzibacteriaceae bacterium]|nr:PD-(D/E)XK nuclease family protein [Candidatus Krumholzibacteriaceae bacterium]